MPSDGSQKLVGWETYHREGEGKVMRERLLADGDHVYHMLPWGYARSILEDGRLRLSPVGTWSDPYEKWWCEKLFNRSSALRGVRAYGLCWTTGKYDEPRWRMAGFRVADPIVRIRCRAGVILKAGRKLISAKTGALFLGKVRYKPEATLLSLAASVTAGERKEVTRTAAEMLLHKRNAFRFEEEVRLLWLDREAAKDCIYLDVDLPAAIEQVMITPYATAEECQTIMREFRWPGIDLKRSLLLQVPKS